MLAWRLGRLVGSLLLLAVLAVGSFAASGGGLEHSGEGWRADPIPAATTDPPPATEEHYHLDAWEWT